MILNNINKNILIINNMSQTKLKTNKNLIQSYTMGIPDKFGLITEDHNEYCDSCNCYHNFVFGNKDIEKQSEWLILWYEIANTQLMDNCILKQYTNKHIS
jgi:hypothetical protein